MMSFFNGKYKFRTGVAECVALTKGKKDLVKTTYTTGKYAGVSVYYNASDFDKLKPQFMFSEGDPE